MSGSSGNDNSSGVWSRGARKFQYRDANFHIIGDGYDIVCSEIVRLRSELQLYVDSHIEFRESLTPVDVKSCAPESARRMALAAKAVGVGPMAAVAGTIAQMSAQAAADAGITEVVVENGGDLFLYSESELSIGLYAGDSPLSDKLALRVGSSLDGLAVCSSSSQMGHSLSFGKCDLATVVSKNASLADAAATRAANMVSNADDIDTTLKLIEKISGILGVIIIKDDRIGIAGTPGEIVANRDASLINKVTRDPSLKEGGSKQK